MKAANSGREPIVFIPSVENLDPEIIKTRIASNSTNKPNSNDDLKAINRLPRETYETIYVFGDAGGVDNKLYPGYTIDESGGLTYYGMISESFAWNNDVVVIGVEEESSYNPDEFNPARLNPVKALSSRDSTRLEIGGRILVPDISAIEPWIRGKLEMKYFVNSSSGTLIKERAFAPIRRRDINNKWIDLNDPIGNWYLSIWGPYQYERWIEEDGGSSTTITTPITPVAGGSTYTITTTLKGGDNNCGLAAVDYNDSYYWEIPVSPENWRIYYISYMNFQRESRQ